MKCIATYRTTILESYKGLGTDILHQSARQYQLMDGRRSINNVAKKYWHFRQLFWDLGLLEKQPDMIEMANCHMQAIILLKEKEIIHIKMVGNDYT